MEQKTQLRKVTRVLFTNCADELRQKLDGGKSASEIKVSWQLLQEQYEELQTVDVELRSLMLEDTSTTDAGLIHEMQQSKEYKRRFLELQNEVESRMEKNAALSVSGTGSVADSVQLQRRCRLPAIELKKFDGSVRGWLPFWTSFNKVHENPGLDEADKFEYLRLATIPGSRARALVESYPATAANYEHAITSLKARFGREELQIELYVRELLKIIVSNAAAVNKPDTAVLYDQIVTQTRALDSLGITSTKWGAMLFPLIESCIPEELLRVWHRSINTASLVTADAEVTDEDAGADDNFGKRLSSLMQFLRHEVENEQHIELATERLGLTKSRKDPKQPAEKQDRIPTAMGLVNLEATRHACIFCGKTHDSASCFQAAKWSMEKRKQMVNTKRACFKCLKVGHSAKVCRTPITCIVCGKPHVTLMCPTLSSPPNEPEKRDEESRDDKRGAQQTNSCSNFSRRHVFMQTLQVMVIGRSKKERVRALIDSGAQNSYILQATANRLGLHSFGREKIMHSLFGGSKAMHCHQRYHVVVENQDYSTEVELLSQNEICNSVEPVFEGPWIQELSEMDIALSDQDDSSPIELLFGSDVAGQLYTGRRHQLQCGLVAMETVLGWTLMGKVPVQSSNTMMTTASLLFDDVGVEKLWRLDALGIADPGERRTQEQLNEEARHFFVQTTKINSEGRYEVRLPWLQDHPPLPENYQLSKKRLESTLKKVERQGLFGEYDAIFQEWLEEGIVEIVNEEESASGMVHYLPHRPVVKESSSTTKVRPVFDASAREKRTPSLNQCLEKGINLVELIPDLLIGFRIGKIGVTSDIKKAFLQISIAKEDRDVLRFLWVDGSGNEVVMRHRRVVFGVNCSPFMLGATLEHHLQRAIDETADMELKQIYEKLRRSFYVDNCVTSVESGEELTQFVSQASMVMSRARFDLRGWESSVLAAQAEHPNTPMLGLQWNRVDDTLSLCQSMLTDVVAVVEGNLPVTKRIMLSLTQRIFDPIGFSSPTTLYPKLLLQKAWKAGIGWDEPVDEETRSGFTTWLAGINCLMKIQIPRWIGLSFQDAQFTLHTFCDASQTSYAAAVFLRGVHGDSVVVRLLAAKSRVAPLKKLTIPRLELMAAVIGARLCSSVKTGLKRNLPEWYWSDSTTTLAWIGRDGDWSVFVSNRVAEIAKLSSARDWHHVPGSCNPADLPSRGASPQELQSSRWWEGPDWLRLSPERWPVSIEACDEEEVRREKTTKTVTCVAVSQSATDEWHLKHFSSFERTVRMMAWLRRFLTNARPQQYKLRGELSVEEITSAEIVLLKLIQTEAFVGKERDRLSTLATHVDENNLIRVKTRIIKRKDDELFLQPVVLPAKHPSVEALVLDAHVKACHVRANGLLSILRERFWILGGRRTIAAIIKGCVTCKRHLSKPLTAEEAVLPEARVRDAAAFEVVGVDFAGPVHLKGEVKAWICVFTCAIYRAVHLELCTSLSAVDFCKALRRFVSRRGRPKIVYSDNGTNFVGAENAVSAMDWDAVQRQASIDRIEWRFNPPAAPWWGGFWERMVGVMKNLLRRILGRSLLNYEDMLTVLCDCESVINSRPLTYQSTNPDELLAITPVMFLREQVVDGVADYDAVDAESLTKKVTHLQRLREQLRERFRSDYLGQLRIVQRKRASPQLQVGEIVLIGSEAEKRMSWPLARVVEVFAASDGQVRLARVRTSKGYLLRAVQRIYRLECAGDNDIVKFVPAARSEPLEQSQKEGDAGAISDSGGEECAGVSEECRGNTRMTRSGREVKRPKRFM